MRGLTDELRRPRRLKFLDGVEMRAAWVAQVVEAVGRRLGDLHVNLAIEQAQRIAVDAIMAVVAELVPMRPAPFHQCVAKSRAARRVSDRIDFKS